MNDELFESSKHVVQSSKRNQITNNDSLNDVIHYKVKINKERVDVLSALIIEDDGSLSPVVPLGLPFYMAGQMTAHAASLSRVNKVKARLLRKLNNKK